MTKTRRMLAGLAVTLAAAVTPSTPASRADSAVTPVQVKTLDFVYRLDADTLRARVGLVTGEAIDFDVTDRETFLRVAQIFSSGRTRLNAQIQDRKVVGLGVTVQ
jgi:hypothetical protein